MELRAVSCAKINIGLRIVNRRADGYHNLESLFQEIDWCDEVIVRLRKEGVRIETNFPEVPVDERNLCYRAFEVLREKFPVSGGVEIILKKKIPPGAGLGGGSSNAATCLKMFNQLFQLNLTTGELLKLASRIGSDVPFFVLGKTAIVKGRGEVVIPVRLPFSFQCLLVLPKLHISTEFIYKNFELPLTHYSDHVKFDVLISELRKLEDLKEKLPNDLETVAVRFYSELAGVRKRLEASGARYVSLSGSGSAMFGLFPPEVTLEAVAKKFFPEYRVVVAKPVLIGV